MEIQQLALSFLQFTKNYFASFWLSVTQPGTFFATGTFKKRKVEPVLYLYTSLLLYLIFYTTVKTYYTEISNAIANINFYTSTDSFIQILLFTIPPYLFFIILIATICYPLRTDTSVNYKSIAFVLFSNSFIIEFSLFFFYLIIYYVAKDNLSPSKLILFTDYGIILLKNIIKYLNIIIPIFAGFRIYMSLGKSFNFWAIPIFLTATYTDNFLNNIYRVEYNILRKEQLFENALMIYDINRGNNELFLKWHPVQNDKAKIYTYLTIKNNSNKTILWDTDIPITTEITDIKSINSLQKKRGEYLLNDDFTFDSVKVDGHSGKYLSLAPGDAVLAEVFRITPLDSLSAVRMLKAERDTIKVTMHLPAQFYNGDYLITEKRAMITGLMLEYKNGKQFPMASENISKAIQGISRPRE